MKILQIIPTLGSGGAEHFVVELSNELVRLGHVCHILTLYDIESSNQLINMVDNNIYVSSLHKKLGFDVSCLLKVFQYIRINSYDVVHAHVGAIKYITLASSLLNKIKFVATIHSEASREAGKSIDKWARLYMFKCKRCLPVTISEESELSFERFYKLNAHLIYNGVSKYNGMPLRDLRDNPEQIVFIHPASKELKTKSYYSTIVR
jgi:hypothetical protein